MALRCETSTIMSDATVVDLWSISAHVGSLTCEISTHHEPHLRVLLSRPGATSEDPSIRQRWSRRSHSFSFADILNATLQIIQTENCGQHGIMVHVSGTALRIGRRNDRTHATSSPTWLAAWMTSKDLIFNILFIRCRKINKHGARQMMKASHAVTHTDENDQIRTLVNVASQEAESFTPGVTGVSFVRICGTN